jgi:glycosyltransferase involved in cell wall biosynthesis
MSQLPTASVVVAVYNAEATLRACVDSLLRLDYPADRLEILCVDNASTDATGRILAAYADPVRVLRESVRGPAAARNRGLRHARGEVVALTDADCTVAPDWLRHLVAPLADASIGIVGGCIRSRRPCNVIEAFGERIHDHAWALAESRPAYAITMNWASRARVLADIGGFDEALLRSSDVDGSYRIQAQGYRLVYEPRAVVYHRNERTPWGLMHEGYVHGFHAPAVSRKHAAFVQQVRQAVPTRTRPAQRSLGERLLWSLFNFGKRMGRLHESLRHEPESRA